MTDYARDGTFFDHLEELRQKIIMILAWFFLACILSYIFNNEILKIASKPILSLQKNIAFISPVEPFLGIIKLVLFSGLVLTVPFLIYQIYLFVKPALSIEQAKILNLCLASGVFLFYLGIWLGYSIIVPAGLRILFGFGTNLMVSMVTINNYLSFLIWMLLIIGLIFQLPVVMFFLGTAGIVEILWFKKMRRTIFTFIVIAIAFITPTTDAITTLILSGVLIFLYEITLIFLEISERAKKLKN